MTRHNQSGFSMIEVLVTIVVISFGFLSLLSLQMYTLNTLTTNNQRMVAMSITSGMSERLRANRNNINFYNSADTSKFTKDCSLSGSCSMIEQDIWEFKQAIAAEPQLSNGIGLTSILAGMADITIRWSEKNGKTVTYTMQVPL